MSAFLNGLGHQLFVWLDLLSIELAALAVLVLVAGRLVKSPALRHLLWLAVLVKPLIAVTVSSPYTVFSPFAPFAHPGWDVPFRIEGQTLTPLPAAPAAIAPNSMPLTPAALGALLWLMGATLLTGRIVLGFGILQRLRRQAHVQRDGPLFEALRHARAALDCPSKVEVATSASIRSPMVFGILRPLIVVPADLVQRLRGDELTLVLMHELAHVRRYDNLTLLLQRLVTAILFFHPALWLCGRMLRREAEQACDDLVVGATGRPEAYARGLTVVAEEAAHANQSAGRIPMMSTFASTESDLSQRIRRTLHGGAPRMGPWARVLAAVLLFPLAAVTLPAYGAADNWVGGETASAIDPDTVLTFEELKERLRGRMQVIADSLGDEENERLEVEAVLRSIAEIANESLEAGAVLRSIAEIRDIPTSGEKQMGTDPDEWSAELRAQLLALKPDSTTDEVLEILRNARAGTVVYWYGVGVNDRMKRADLFLVVDQDGNMKLNDKPVTFSTLGEELRQQQSLMDSTTTIVIQTNESEEHERASYRQIVEIMDIARKAGLVDHVLPMEGPQAGR